MTPAGVREFLLQLAPELGGLNVVYLSTTGAAGGGGFLGCSAPSLQASLREFCTERAPAILLNDTAIIEEAEQFIAGCREIGYPVDAGEATRFAFLRIGVHELGHVLVHAPPYFADVRNAVSLPMLLQLFEKAFPTPAVGFRYGPMPWFGHESDWLRLTLHSRHRAEALGVKFSAANLIEAYRFNLSHADAYRFALADEPERLSRATFEEIKRTAPPADFVRLWKKDTRARAAGSIGSTEGK